MASVDELFSGENSVILRDYGITISLTGAFNPAIMQPAWFGAKRLLTESEVNEVSEFYAHPDLVRFNTESLALEASRNVLELTTKDYAYERRLEEIAASTMRTLPHSPIHEVSVARYGHFGLRRDQAPSDLLATAFGNPHMN